MTTENRDNWILLKPDGYLAIPASKFLAISNEVKNIKSEWASKGAAYLLSNEPMSMLLMSDEQMTAILVRDRITQASARDPLGAGCSTSATS